MASPEEDTEPCPWPCRAVWHFGHSWFFASSSWWLPFSHIAAVAKVGFLRPHCLLVGRLPASLATSIYRSSTTPAMSWAHSLWWEWVQCLRESLGLQLH